MRLGLPAELHIAEFPEPHVHRQGRAHGRRHRPRLAHLLTEVDVPNPKGELLPGAYAQVTSISKAAVTAAGRSVAIR